MNGPYHYYFANNEIIVSNRDGLAPSERTFTIDVNTLATEKYVLQTLSLVSCMIHTEDAVGWFKSYISDFSSNYEEKRKYLEADPILRICVTDSDIQDELLRLGITFE